MKKILTFIAAVMLCSSAAMAQEPIYLLDFENATTVADFGGIQHGSGAIATSTDAKFGKYYQNWPDATGEATIATNFLEVVPTDNPWAKLTTDLTAFTIGFWVNATVANTNKIGNYWGSLFTAYTEAGTSATRTWYYPVGPDLRYQGQFHYNNAGYADNNHDDYMASVAAWSSDNNWHHFAWVFTNLGSTPNFTLTLYVDGTQKYSVNEVGGDQACASANMLNGLDRFVIGGNSPIWADPDNAYGYDDIAIYNTALTKDQIDAIISAKTVTTGVETIKAAKTAEKAVRYNLAGQQVGAGYKGVAVENGKKIVVR